MQRFYVLFSATLLTAFIALIALKVHSEILEQASVNIEEIELEDKLDGETKEIEFQLKDFNHHASDIPTKTIDANIFIDYLFAIKSNHQKVNSPPPEA